jgi:predicted RNA-binding Zn ribbon-like protein
MPAPAFAPIDKVEMIGGLPCIDFTNTTGNRGGSVPRERLRAYPDLVVFGVRAGLLDPRAAARLRLHARREPRRAARCLDRARELRETLYRLLVSAAERRRPDPTDLRRFTDGYREAARHRSIVWSTPPRWSFADHDDDLDALGWKLAIGAADLLCSDALGRLRKCGDCDWLFLDRSKNASRRWCRKICGDRVKARRYYRRVRGHPRR